MRVLFATVVVLLYHISYSQEYDTQVSNKTVSTFISIKEEAWAKEWLSKDLWNFQLKFLNAANDTIWKADTCPVMDYDSVRFLVRVDIPENVRNNTAKIWCGALLKMKPEDSARRKIEYGGVNISAIKLNIQSSPQGAETFLVPNRIWQRKFQGKQWKDIADLLTDYRVNPTFTNTYVFIDETVYTVVCKLGTKFSMIRHNTQPMTVAKEQNVMVPFVQ